MHSRTRTFSSKLSLMCLQMMLCGLHPTFLLPFNIDFWFSYQLLKPNAWVMTNISCSLVSIFLLSSLMLYRNNLDEAYTHYGPRGAMKLSWVELWSVQAWLGRIVCRLELEILSSSLSRIGKTKLKLDLSSAQKIFEPKKDHM